MYNFYTSLSYGLLLDLVSSITSGILGLIFSVSAFVKQASYFYMFIKSFCETTGIAVKTALFIVITISGWFLFLREKFLPKVKSIYRKFKSLLDLAEKPPNAEIEFEGKTKRSKPPNGTRKKPTRVNNPRNRNKDSPIKNQTKSRNRKRK